MRKAKPPVLRPHEEEDILIDIIGKAKRGEPVLREDVISKVIKFVRSDMRNNPFRDGRPGDKWFSLFRRRHNSFFMQLTPEQLLAVEKVGFTEKVLNTVLYTDRRRRRRITLPAFENGSLRIPDKTVVRNYEHKNSYTLRQKTSTVALFTGNTEKPSPMSEGSCNITATDDEDSKSQEGMNDSDDFQHGSKLEVMDFNDKWVNIDVDSDEENRVRSYSESRKQKYVPFSTPKIALGKKHTSTVVVRRKHKKIKKLFDELTFEYKGLQHHRGLEEDSERWNMEIPKGTSPLTFIHHDGFIRASVIIPDKKLPQGWTKHTIKRKTVTKWDVIITSPDGRNFRSFNELRSYFADLKQPFPEECFDFRVGRKLEMIRSQEKSRKKFLQEALLKEPSLVLRRVDGEMQPELQTLHPNGRHQDNQEKKTEQSTLFNLASPPLPLADQRTPDGGYTCCGKTFRKENLFQMHMKHYHPEYSDLFGYTPTVEDLAYARRTFGNHYTLELSQAEAMASKNSSLKRVSECKGVPKALTDLTPAFVEIPKIKTREEDLIEVIEEDPLSITEVKKEPVEIKVLKEEEPSFPIEVKIKEEPVYVEGDDITEDYADTVVLKKEEKIPIEDKYTTDNEPTNNTVVETPPPVEGMKIEIKIETPEEQTEEPSALLVTPEEPFAPQHDTPSSPPATQLVNPSLPAVWHALQSSGSKTAVSSEALIVPTSASPELLSLS